MAKLSKAATWVLVTSFLLVGTLSSVLSDVMLKTSAPINDTGATKPFRKPWFQVWGMFLGMVMCGPILAVKRLYQRCTGQERKPLATGRPLCAVNRMILVPAIFDLLATMFQSVALLFTNVSIWQMMRGSICIFTALQRYFYFGKKTRRHESVGIALVVVGLCIVGAASIVSPTKTGETGDVSTTLKLVGIGCVLIAQCIQAMQTVVEEELLHDVEADPLYIVFMEGFWGLLATSVVFMPIAQSLTFATEGGGIHEDVWPEEFYMLMHNSKLFWVAFMYILVIALYNISGMIICDETEATTRNVLDAGRTLCVWFLALMLNFWPLFSGASETFGWPYSFIELAGFLTLIVGMFTYYGMMSAVPGLRPRRHDGMSPKGRCSPAGTRAVASLNNRGEEILLEEASRYPLA